VAFQKLKLHSGATGAALDLQAVCAASRLMAESYGFMFGAKGMVTGVLLKDVEERNAATPALAPANDYVRRAQGPHLELDGRTIYQLWRHGEPGAKPKLRWHKGVVAYLGHRGRFPWFRVDYDDGDSGIIGMAALRDIIARMPAEPPIIAQEPAVAATSPSPAPVPTSPQPRAAPSGKRGNGGARSVEWAPDVTDPKVGTLRRSARREKAARALGLLTKESMQDARVADAYASL
jgi:hypothetical protein